ncbi:MAG: hypothetical protein COY81_04455 [Candidatus Pacebacteria bacterium CG_4_10_14_0_8_um_filter_43_12]|nr:MAG: hypothetical protein COU66_00295 [Candidatus Pacebacteria bacterium CG10_big_fil_rev_8_21_14_0_10_44_11]PIY79137.1 MAG: hypothetical protein COY81_04455 [Candidatus Pacebacteria bacterium CG_4_10_14_0_8_um_filter_43_12]
MARQDIETSQRFDSQAQEPAEEKRGLDVSQERLDNIQRFLLRYSFPFAVLTGTGIVILNAIAGK